MDEFIRTEMLIGRDAMEKLRAARVAVFGIGGVGGHAAEALARSGVGSLVLVDNDVVSLSNINRQVIALHSTLGRYKTEVMRERILDINPKAQVEIHTCFFLPENAGDFNFSAYDYVVDAVDTVAAKLEIIERAKRAGTPVISAMGAGNKLNPAAFSVMDIYKTQMCPLARVMRRELRRRDINSLKVVCSSEPALEPRGLEPAEENEFRQEAEENVSTCETEGGKAAGSRRAVPGSISYVPSIAGLLLAGEVIQDLTKNTKTVTI